MSIYKTKTMLQAISQVKPLHTFLRDTFFGIQQTALTETVEVDIKKGKRRMAPFVSPRIGGKVIEREGFETREIKTPKIAPERVMTIDDISTRSLGENVYSQRTPEERQQAMLMNDLLDLDDSITRREEWMCREVLLNGKVLISGEGVEKEVNFGFANKKTLASGKKWSASGINPLADLKAWRLEIIKATGKAPSICIMASNVVDVFIQNPEIEKMLDIQRLNVGLIEPSVRNEAITFIGKINSLGIELYSYDEWYADDEGAEQAMIPDNTVVLASKDLGKIMYGAVTQMENGTFCTYEGFRVPKQYSDDKNEVKMVRMTSRPLPVPYDIESWVVATVL